MTNPPELTEASSCPSCGALPCDQVQEPVDLRFALEQARTFVLIAQGDEEWEVREGADLCLELVDAILSRDGPPLAARTSPDAEPREVTGYCPYCQSVSTAEPSEAVERVTKLPQVAIDAWAEYDPPEFKHESSRIRDAFMSGYLAALTPTSPVTGESAEFVERLRYHNPNGYHGKLHYQAADHIEALETQHAAKDARIAELGEEAEFLCARLREVENELSDDHTGREFNGHVVPSLARMEMLINKERVAP